MKLFMINTPFNFKSTYNWRFVFSRNPNHILLMIVIVLPSISSTLDLSEWIRSGKQLDGQDASAIGLGMTTLFLQF